MPLKSRLYHHIHAAKITDRPFAVHNWMKSVDYDIAMDIIEECPEGDLEFLYGREIYWIAHYRQLQGTLRDKSTPDYTFNQTDGGGGAYGYKHTEEELERRRQRKGHWAGITGPEHPRFGLKMTDEQRKRMSTAKLATVKRGKDHHNFGKTVSPETRRRQSEAKQGENHWAYGTGGPSHYNTGRKHTPESSRKKSEGNKGKIRSEETRRRMSEAHKGKPLSDETKKRLSEATKGQPNKGRHTRWHTNRGIVDETCLFCTELTKPLGIL